MPTAWSRKRERQYGHIVKACVHGGRSKKVCKRIAAATVQKTRRRKGELRLSSLKGLGTGVAWDKLARAAGRVAAREIQKDVDCRPGSYELRHLSFDEYAASRAATFLRRRVRSATADATVAEERRIAGAADRGFAEGFTSELKKLRPRLRECGED